MNAPKLDPDRLNQDPLVDWNSVRDQKLVEPGLELSCKRSLVFYFGISFSTSFTVSIKKVQG